MQKQTNFFEQNVQWIALGLGGLFLLFMVFTYVVKRPVEVTVAGKPLGPGEVDAETLAVPVKQLRQEIARTDIPAIPQKDYVQDFVAKIQGSGEALPSLAATGIASTLMQPVQVEKPGDVVPGGPQIAKDSKFPVTELPKIPAARPLAETHGRSQVTFQDPNWQPNELRPNELPKMVVADKDWWSGGFQVNAEALAKSFLAAFNQEKIEQFGLPAAKMMETALIDVELVRQELLPNGKFGNETVIPPLQNSLRMPFPGKAAKEPQVLQYLNEITKLPQELTSPVFYEVLAGDPWMVPNEQAENLLALDREARKARREQAMQQQKQLAQQHQLQARPGRRGPVGMEGDMMEMEDAPEVARFPGRLAPPARIPRPGAPGVRPPEGVPLAAGKANNVQMLANIDIIAHDDTVQPGKTYRYKLRYRLYNPIWKNKRVAPQELIEQFAITAPDSAWTKPVTMRPKVEFFLAGPPSGETAPFDVFEWKDGQMKKNTVKVAAGDAIGGTGWTLVDVRGSGRTSYGLVMDEAGQVARRDPNADKESPRYQDLLDAVELGANPQVGMRQ